MKNFFAKLKIKPLTFTVVLGLLLFFGNALRPLAAEVNSPSGVPYPFNSTANESGNNSCDIYMKDFAAKLTIDFGKFIDTNFKNKSSTSSLLQGALAKYRELRTTLMTAYGQYYPNVGSFQLITAVQPGSCMKIIQETLAAAKTLLKTHAVATSGVKKSTALLEKYQGINAQLSNLFQQFVYMKAYLDSFAGKLACYPKSACIKG